MENVFDQELWEEKHKNLSEKVESHGDALKEHEHKINKLVAESVELKTDLKNLCKQLEGLTTTMKWFIGLMVGSFVAFFFYAVQHNIFK
ncbi:membrane protein [Clostridium zeae]|uniref:Membrane protein n=1 Tax=Clostridium zeae TaxID=2759022 RepID=A0ABQ1E8X0_9CLOT|nr:hemolysin XhlA family protein [Clostridium zeae]GFZ31227.1 membrane protein [Clostridium zeae]